MSDIEHYYGPARHQGEQEVKIDLGKLLRLITKHRYTVFVTGIVSFLVAMVLCAALIPQSFTSQISLSFPQTPQPSALNLLTGATGAGTRYTGVLRSRHFAEEVVKRTNIQKLCGFRTEDDAVDALVKGVGINDNVRDSLVYCSVTLPGPPRLSQGANAARERIKEAARDAADAYADVLRQYMATSDTDRESVLVRAAHEQLSEAKKEYEATVGRLSAYVIRPRQRDVSSTLSATPATPDSDQASPGGQTSAPAQRGALSSTAAKELESLYVERGKLEADLQSATTAQHAGTAMKNSLLNRLGSLPSEDPLLISARSLVNTARVARDSALLQFGPDHPEVIVAQQRLKLAEQNLRKQTTAVAKQETSQDLSVQVNLTALSARLDVVNRLIRAAEAKAQRGVEFTQQFERRRNDVLLRLEVLKATASQAAILSLQTVSLKNRMAVVDTARLAKTGSPGLPVFLAMSLFLSVVTVSVLLVRLAKQERRAVVEAPMPVGVT